MSKPRPTTRLPTPSRKPTPKTTRPPPTATQGLRTLPSALLSRLLSLPTTLRTHLPTAPQFRSLALIFSSFYASMILTRTYLINYAGNVGNSMVPTVSDTGHSYVIYSPLYSHGRGVKLGDIVQVRHPMFRDMIAGKRVLGMPGDVVVRGRAGEGGVGGRVADGSWGGMEQEGKDGLEPEMIRVPEGHVWLEGDNLAWSRDSRVFGAVPMALIRGKALWIVEGWGSRWWRGVWRGQMRRVEEEDMEVA